MSILGSEEDIMRDLERPVMVIMPLISQFEEHFKAGITPVLLVDPKQEIGLYNVADDNDALYIDLSQSIPYRRLCRIVKDAAAIMFDNIDRIPDSEDKEDIQHLVKYALRKEDDVPTPDNTSISFGDYRIGARCSRIPDYLSEGSPAFPIYCVVPE